MEVNRMNLDRRGMCADPLENPQQDLSNRARLPMDSEERNRIEYLLQMSLQAHSKSISIKDIWAVSSPHLSLRFQKRCQRLVTLDSWVDLNMLNKQNKLEDLISRGFSISEQGLVFNSGTIGLAAAAANAKNEKERKLYHFILCKIGVGKSYQMTSDEIDEHIQRGERIDIPHEYDSIYINDQKLLDQRSKSENAIVDGEQTGAYHLRFIIKESDLILPCYVVTFDIDPQDLHNPNTEMCIQCEKTSASVYCLYDKAALCIGCDKTLHSANKVVSKHIRVPIKEKPSILVSRCKYHPDVNVEFYCHLCQVPVCVHCKMVGNHATGNAVTHKLAPIKEAYDLAMMASRKADPFLNERKSHIEIDLKQLDEKLNAIQHNAMEAEKEIRCRMEDALDKLRRMTMEKTQIVYSEKIDLLRESRNIHCLQAFLEMQQDMLGPVEFLEAWGRHAKFRTELHSPNPYGGIARSKYVHPEIRVEGTIDLKSKIINEYDLSRPQSGEGMKDEDLDISGASEASARIFNNLAFQQYSVPSRPMTPAMSEMGGSQYSDMGNTSMSSALAAPGGLSMKELVMQNPAIPHQRHTLRASRYSMDQRPSTAFYYTSAENAIEDRIASPLQRHFTNLESRRHRDNSPARSEISVASSTAQSVRSAWNDVWTHHTDRVEKVIGADQQYPFVRGKSSRLSEIFN